MPGMSHTAVYTDNDSRKDLFARRLLNGDPPEALSAFRGCSGALFSNSQIALLLNEEARHDHTGLELSEQRKLATFSSGERKKALLRHLLSESPEFLILDNLFDNLDSGYRKQLEQELSALSTTVTIVQLLSRKEDLLSFIDRRAFLQGSELVGFPDYQPPESSGWTSNAFSRALPPPPEIYDPLPETLVEFDKVDLSYEGRSILKEVSWKVGKGELWELRGPNGSGKTSLITMINGDNPKAYGQQIHLFGRQKGSGESVWEIKERIGYFTPSITDRFRGNHSASHMLISGMTDSVGLYVKPTDRQQLLARQWLSLLGMEAFSDVLFHTLSEGRQRLLMCARAMVKHPPLLILDEPTGGLDEASALMVVGLVRKMAAESETAIIFVSHREEPGLQADHVLELVPGPSGSRGVIHHNTPQ